MSAKYETHWLYLLTKTPTLNGGQQGKFNNEVIWINLISNLTMFACKEFETADHQIAKLVASKKTNRAHTLTYAKNWRETKKTADDSLHIAHWDAHFELNKYIDVWMNQDNLSSMLVVSNSNSFPQCWITT